MAEYFALLTDDQALTTDPLPPVVQSLKGSLKGSKLDKDDYRRHLVEKYR